MTPPEDKPVGLASKSHFGVGFVLNPRWFVRNAWFYLSVSLGDLYAIVIVSERLGEENCENVSPAAAATLTLSDMPPTAQTPSASLLCICTIVAAWFAL